MTIQMDEPFFLVMLSFFVILKMNFGFFFFLVLNLATSGEKVREQYKRLAMQKTLAFLL